MEMPAGLALPCFGGTCMTNSIPFSKQFHRDFKAAAFVGIRKSDDEVGTFFFINDEEIASPDLQRLLNGLAELQNRLRQSLNGLDPSTTG
jgi:hypothetical protein